MKKITTPIFVFLTLTAAAQWYAPASVGISSELGTFSAAIAVEHEWRGALLGIESRHHIAGAAPGAVGAYMGLLAGRFTLIGAVYSNITKQKEWPQPRVNMGGGIRYNPARRGFYFLHYSQRRIQLGFGLRVGR